jgi:adenosylcobinamide-GDP ribazoletransferase
MMQQWKVFLTAVMFLTRLKVPEYITHDPAYLARAPKYFPLVGWIVGGISLLIFLVFERYISTDIGILACMIAMVLVTGAFHEDGFADCCDGFGGGWTKEKILSIMKDSRLGSYGVIGLISILAAKFLLLRELPRFSPDLAHPSSNIFFNYRYFLLTVMAGQSLSRLMPLLLIRFSTYVTAMDTSKSASVTLAPLSWGELLLAAVFGLLPFVLLSWHFLLAILPVLYATYELKVYFKKWIGGYTGDCLGAVQQVSEVVFYLGVILVWRYVI